MSYQKAMEWVSSYANVLDMIRDGNATVNGYDISDGYRIKEDGQARYWIDSVFLYKGLSTVVYSRARSGKTHLNSWALLRERILHPEREILHNVPLFWDDDPRLSQLALPGVTRVRKMSEMLRLGSETVLNGGVPASILDEMDHVLLSQNWREDENVSWKMFTFIEGHLEFCGPLLTYHDRGDIPMFFRRGKLANQILSLHLHGGRRYILSPSTRPRSLLISGLVVPFSTHGGVGFKIDISVGKLHSRLHGTRKKDIAEQVLANIDSCMIRSRSREEEDTEEEEEREPLPLHHDPCPRLEGLAYTWTPKRFRREGDDAQCPKCKKWFKVKYGSKEGLT